MKRLTATLLSLLALVCNAYAAKTIADSSEALTQDSIAEVDELTNVADESEGESLNMLEIINHHISDSHVWNVFGYKADDGTEKSIDIYLPVMAYYKGQFLFTMSSAFKDGATVTKDGNVYSIKHDGKLYVNDTERPFDFSITRNVMSMFMSVAILLLVFVGAARSLRKDEVPHGGTSLCEMLVLFVKDIADDQIGKEKSGKYVYFLLTLFYFIWFNNLIGLIPFFPGSSNLSGNIAFTGILAVFTFILTNFNASKGYWVHNFTVPGVPAVLKPIMIPIEIISMFTKPFTLLIRLFANITGGHIIIISLISMIFLVKAYAMAVPSVLLALMIFCLELIFGALQAYIFTLLSALYIGLAVNEESHHEE